MKIAVLGGDGYCGWATALYLSQKGHAVAVIDNYIRRLWDHELGAQTLTPIRPLTDRLRVWQNLTGKTIETFVGDVTDKRLDGLSGQVLPHTQAIGQRTNGCKRLRAQSVVPQPPYIIVNNGDGVALLRKINRRRRTAIAVPTEHGNLHQPSSSSLPAL